MVAPLASGDPGWGRGLAVQIRLEGLQHEYEQQGRARPVLSLPSFVVGSGQQVCLVGNSGSGKTTLLNIVAGVLTPTRGRVVLGDQDLAQLSPAACDRFRARHVGYVFQSANLLPWLTAEENLTLALRLADEGARSAALRAAELLGSLGLSARRAAKAGTLSAGEQQRVAIARAICKRPAIVVADEPTANLDDESAAAAVELLQNACGRATLLVASHDERLIARFSDVRSVRREAAEARRSQ